jgi:hypothetical protein
MEWAIPLQNFEVSKTQLGAPSQGTKLMSPLSYVDEGITFTTLTLLLPSLAVKNYDAATGRLQISLQGAGVATKLQEFQEMLIQSVYANQRGWFPGERVVDKENIRLGFQPFVEKSSIHLYCPSSPAGPPNEIYSYVKKEWVRGTISPTLLAAGKTVRLGIKFQGVSYHQHPLSKVWTGKFRLQHRIVAIMLN